MRELLRSNDLVHLSWAQAALAPRASKACCSTPTSAASKATSGRFPRRLMVRDDLLERARKVLAQAEQAHASG